MQHSGSWGNAKFVSFDAAFGVDDHGVAVCFMRRPEDDNLGSLVNVANSSAAYRTAQSSLIHAERHVGDVRGLVVANSQKKGRVAVSFELGFELAGVDWNTHAREPRRHARRREASVASLRRADSLGCSSGL